MAQAPAGLNPDQATIDACRNAAQEFDLTAMILRSRLEQGLGRPEGLTTEDERFLERNAISDAAGGRSARFHTLNPTVKKMVDEFEWTYRPGNMMQAFLLAGTMGLGYYTRFLGKSDVDADQTRRRSRYAIEVGRCRQIAGILRAKAAELGGR